MWCCVFRSDTFVLTSTTQRWSRWSPNPIRLELHPSFLVMEGMTHQEMSVLSSFARCRQVLGLQELYPLQQRTCFCAAVWGLLTQLLGRAAAQFWRLRKFAWLTVWRCQAGGAPMFLSKMCARGRCFWRRQLCCSCYPWIAFIAWIMTLEALLRTPWWAASPLWVQIDVKFVLCWSPYSMPLCTS